MPRVILFVQIGLAVGVVLLAACVTSPKPPKPLDAAAEAYVRLVLAAGRHDANYVDAYYGPKEIREEIDRGAPAPVPELLVRARDLLAKVRACPPEPRQVFLEKQLVAVEAFLRRLDGERFTLAEEARLFFDVPVPPVTVAELEDARAKLESVVPGEGDLGDRVEAVRKRCVVPPDKLHAVADAVLARVRETTGRMIPLPAGESLRIEFVTGKSWGGYNWYEGNLHSLVQFDTRLPIELGSFVGTIVHEGYPGHHVYNALLEEACVRKLGWPEFTVYPLYSPQSLIAEGTANVARDIVFDDASRREFLATKLAPLAGLDPEAVLTYDTVMRELEPLRHAGPEAARMLLDDGAPDDEVVAYLRRYELRSEEKARKSLEFARTYRSYVYNYTLGEDLVRAYIGDGPDRVERFFGLLRGPVTPSEIAATRR